MLLRDNVYGTLEEDAVRRDLTVNALYYDCGDDFRFTTTCTAWPTWSARRSVSSADPANRYREDPVRMLRAVLLRRQAGLQH